MSKIIFTDLDGTLTLKDTYLKFLLKNLRFSILLKYTPALLYMSVCYILGYIGDDDVKMRTFKIVFDGYDKEQNIDDFLASIPWNKSVRREIDIKREEGYKIIIVTASPDVYVEHICNFLAYDGFIATKTEKNGKFLNGYFDGKICNFEEKPKRIKEYMNGNTPQYSISYGNSSGDFAMLKFCDESYFVKKLDIKRFEK